MRRSPCLYRHRDSKCQWLDVPSSERRAHFATRGGEIAAMVYSSADCNRSFLIPVSIIRRRAQLPPPLPGQPGPFSLGTPEVLEKPIADAGFSDIRIANVDAPVRLIEPGFGSP